jgi:hypothetical protein
MESEKMSQQTTAPNPEEKSPRTKNTTKGGKKDQVVLPTKEGSPIVAAVKEQRPPKEPPKDRRDPTHSEEIEVLIPSKAEGVCQTCYNMLLHLEEHRAKEENPIEVTKHLSFNRVYQLKVKALAEPSLSLLEKMPPKPVAVPKRFITTGVVDPHAELVTAELKAAFLREQERNLIRASKKEVCQLVISKLEEGDQKIFLRADHPLTEVALKEKMTSIVSCGCNGQKFLAEGLAKCGVTKLRKTIVTGGFELDARKVAEQPNPPQVVYLPDPKAPEIKKVTEVTSRLRENSVKVSAMKHAGVPLQSPLANSSP